MKMASNIGMSEKLCKQDGNNEELRVIIIDPFQHRLEESLMYLSPSKMYCGMSWIAAGKQTEYSTQ